MKRKSAATKQTQNLIPEKTVASPVPTLLNIPSNLPFPQMLKHVIEFLDPNAIHCILNPKQKIKSTKPHEVYNIQKIDVPGGKIEMLLADMRRMESQLKWSLDRFLNENDSYPETIKILLDHKRACVHQAASLDPDNPYTWDGFSAKVIHKEKVLDIPSYQLNFPPAIKEIIKIHFRLRKYFFLALVNLLDTAIQEFSTMPDLKDHPYGWNNNNGVVELTELFAALQFTGRIQYKIEHARPAQIRKQFFALFGVSDKRYDQATSEMLKRKASNKFLLELADSISKKNESIKSTNPKKEKS